MYVLKSALDVGAHLNWIYDRSYIGKVQCRTNSQIDNSYRARLVLDTVSEDIFEVLCGALWGRVRKEQWSRPFVLFFQAPGVKLCKLKNYIY